MIDPDPVNCTHVLPDTVVTVGEPVVALYVAFGRPDPLANCQVLVANLTRVADSRGASVVEPLTALRVTPDPAAMTNEPAVPAFITPITVPVAAP